MLESAPGKGGATPSTQMPTLTMTTDSTLPVDKRWTFQQGPRIQLASGRNFARKAQ